MTLHFEILREATTTRARAGVLHTAHGNIATPNFTLVGTHGVVKFLTMAEAKSIGAQALLSNAYHLSHFANEIEQAGGLTNWNKWRGPTFTDSGGFQVMSMGSGYGKVVSLETRDIADVQRLAQHKDRKTWVTDEGVEFARPGQQTTEFWTPEHSIQIQHQIGADVIFCFDELTSIGESYAYNVAALKRTNKWAQRCLAEHIALKSSSINPNQLLYAVTQGGHYKDLRRQAATELSQMSVNGHGFDGFGLGGAFAKEQLANILRWLTDELPAEKPRHLLGLSRPEDIFVGVESGVDTFDCVAPTREARHGRLYTLSGNINLNNSKYIDSDEPIDAKCDCPICSTTPNKESSSNAGASFARQSLGQLQALLKSSDRAQKALYYNYASLHNLRFVIRLFEQLRAAILAGSYPEFKAEWMSKYTI